MMSVKHKMMRFCFHCHPSTSAVKDQVTMTKAQSRTRHATAHDSIADHNGKTDYEQNLRILCCFFIALLIARSMEMVIKTVTTPLP